MGVKKGERLGRKGKAPPRAGHGGGTLGVPHTRMHSRVALKVQKGERKCYKVRPSTPGRKAQKVTIGDPD